MIETTETYQVHNLFELNHEIDEYAGVSIQYRSGSSVVPLHQVLEQTFLWVGWLRPCKNHSLFYQLCSMDNKEQLMRWYDLPCVTDFYDETN